MWVIVHLLFGLALGEALTRPPGVAPLALIVLALAAHILLDLVPHWDYTRDPRAALWVVSDLALSAAAFACALWWARLPGWVLVTGVVSALPDLDVVDALWWPRSSGARWFPSHWRGFPHGAARPVAGISVQLAVCVASIAVVALVRA